MMQRHLGTDIVSIVSVEWLLDIEKSVYPVEIKKFELQQQREMAFYLSIDYAIVEEQSECFKSIITMGQNALKSIIVINGGASVAFIAFLNNNLFKFLSDDVLSKVYLSLCYALIVFCVGTLLASIGYGLVYFTQDKYYNDSFERFTGGAVKMKVICFNNMKSKYFTSMSFE